MLITPIGFGAFKIGRNTGTKYGGAYELPSDEEADRLLHGVLDLGINHVDTAPAYGLSEERIGRSLAGRRDAFVLSTKVGETYADGRSSYDFSAEAVTASVRRSLVRLRTDHLDLVLIHSDGDDVGIIEHSGACEALDRLKACGDVRAVGLSGKTEAGFDRAMRWADVFMVEYHREDRRMAGVVSRAHEAGIGVLIKKGLASGRLGASEALGFLMGDSAVDSVTLGTLKLDHLRENLGEAVRVRGVKGG